MYLNIYFLKYNDHKIFIFFIDYNRFTLNWDAKMLFNLSLIYVLQLNSSYNSPLLLCLVEFMFRSVYAMETL